jgi:hypothetical protein
MTPELAVPSAPAFALALLGMGLVFLLWPKAAPYLGAALVMGSLYAAEDAAKAHGVAGPIAELRQLVGGSNHALP